MDLVIDSIMLKLVFAYFIAFLTLRSKTIWLKFIFLIFAIYALSDSTSQIVDGWNWTFWSKNYELIGNQTTFSTYSVQTPYDWLVIFNIILLSILIVDLARRW